MLGSHVRLNDLCPGGSEKFVRLMEALAHLDISVDPFGNVTLEHESGARIRFCQNGDLQTWGERDIDQKAGRWVHTNSDLEEIYKQERRVLYGPRGEVLACLE